MREYSRSLWGRGDVVEEGLAGWRREDDWRRGMIGADAVLALFFVYSLYVGLDLVSPHPQSRPFIALPRTHHLQPLLLLLSASSLLFAVLAPLA